MDDNQVLQLTLAWWHNAFTERGKRDQYGERLARFIKVLSHSGELAQFRYGSNEPEPQPCLSKKHSHIPGRSQHQRAIILTPETRFFAIDVDDPSLFYGTATSRLVSRHGAASTRGDGYHVLAHVPDELMHSWPSQCSIPGADVKSNGWVPLPGSVHYSGELYKPNVRDGNLVTIEATAELLAAIRTDRQKATSGTSEGGACDAADGQQGELLKRLMREAIECRWQEEDKAEAREWYAAQALGMPATKPADPWDEDGAEEAFNRHWPWVISRVPAPAQWAWLDNLASRRAKQAVTSLAEEAAGASGGASKVPGTYEDAHRNGAHRIAERRCSVCQEDERAAKRKADERELAELLPERPKRTAWEFAKLPPAIPVISDVLGTGINLLGGPEQNGKSLLARDWCLSAATMVPWRGHPVSEIRNVLWIGPDGMGDFADRWATHALWSEKAASRIYCLDEAVTLLSKTDVDWLLDEYADERPGVIVLDTVYDAMADDNGVKDVGPVIAAGNRIAKAWDAAVVFIGHSGHNGERRFRGSSMWRQRALVDWHMADGLLTCDKSKVTKNRRALSERYDLDYPAIRYLTSPEAVTEDAGRLQIIADDFERHPRDSDSQRARRLAIAFGVSERTARRYIAAFRHAGGHT